jgi:hypothetical protein
MTAQQSLAAARVELDGQRTRGDHLEAALQAAGGDHVRERTRAAEEAEREARGLRGQLATLVGNQQFLESALNRTRYVGDGEGERGTRPAGAAGHAGGQPAVSTARGMWETVRGARGEITGSATSSRTCNVGDDGAAGVV